MIESNYAMLENLPPSLRTQRLKLVDIEREGDKDYYKFQAKPSTSKKWALGLSSLVCPGLGQAANDEWGKGAAFFAAGAILPIMASFAGVISAMNKSKVGLIGSLGLYASFIGSRIWSVVDAVKKAKPDMLVVQSKQNSASSNIATNDEQ